MPTGFEWVIPMLAGQGIIGVGALVRMAFAIRENALNIKQLQIDSLAAEKKQTDLEMWARARFHDIGGDIAKLALQISVDRGDLKVSLATIEGAQREILAKMSGAHG